MRKMRLIRRTFFQQFLAIFCFCLGSGPILAFSSTPPLLHVKPSAIRLEQHSPNEQRISIFVRNRGSMPMDVLSVTPSDPQIRIDLKEDKPGKIYVITAILPAGYK